MRSPTFTAALWMLGAIASFTSMAVAGREVSFELDTFEIMMFRSFVGVAVVVLIGALTGRLNAIGTSNLTLHGMRNIAHFTGQNLWFYAITVIPLAQVFALEFTTPLWAILLSAIFLKERLSWLSAVGAVLGFVGILLVARPGQTELSPGVITASLAAIGFAVTAVCTRKLTQDEPIISILFWLTVMQAGLGVVCAGFDGDIALPSGATLPWLLLIAAAGLFAHFCLTNALAIAPASVVMPFDFVRLPVVAVVGVLIYAEPFSLAILAGGALIFAGNYINLAFGQDSKASAQ